MNRMLVIVFAFLFLLSGALLAVPAEDFGYGSVKLPSTVSGGTGSMADLLDDDDTRYTVAKNQTLTVSGFEGYVDTIDSVYLFVQYTTQPGYDGNNAIFVNGVNTGIVPTDRDYGRIGYIDITGGSFGIDTDGEIQSMSVTFLNNSGGGGKNVYFDYVYVVVNPQSAIPIHPTWSEDFNGTGQANPDFWRYEQGYRRNNELQYYMVGDSNGWMENGNFVIEARNEPSPSDPQKGVMNYTSASIQTETKYYWHYGRAQIRAKIPAVFGMWPAIWGVGKDGQWPHNGEVDIMEYYQEKILANCAVGNTTEWSAKWDTATRAMSTLEAVDPNWRDAYHIWTMQWDGDNVRLYVDNILMNVIPQSWLKNTDGYNTSWGPQYPFTQPFTCWLNLAVGGNGGGSVAGVTFPQRYYIDYWKIWEGATNNVAPTDIALDALNVPDLAPAGTVVGYLTATDDDPAEVHRYQLVSGAGDTHNAQFEVPEFISDNTLLGVVRTAQPIDYANGATRSIRVRVTDIEGATYDKVFTLNVVPQPTIEVNPASASVPEGGTQTFDVRLRILPDTDITVNVTRDSGDENISVFSGASLTFTPANGTDWQTVTLFAAEDADNENGTAIFLCSDPSGTYSSVSFTAVEADKDVPPPVPTGLVGVPSMGQVDLSWDASLTATSYNIKRSTTSGGDYAVVGTSAVTSFSDSVANGMTYYYVVSAVGDSGESADSDEVSVTLLHALPFTEDFEALSVGGLAGQNLWEATNTVVQTNQTVGARAGALTSASAFARQRFRGNETNVWTDLVIQPVFFPGDYTPTDTIWTMVLYFNTNRNPVVYDGATPLVLDSIQVASNDWVRVTLHSDYSAKTWDLYLDEELVASDLGFYDPTQTGYTTLQVQGAGSASVPFDDIRIDVVSTLGDLLATAYANWLTTYYGTTNVDDTQMAASGLHTIREAYVAGLNPTNAASRFVVLGVGMAVSSMELHWDSVSGRLYNVYWTSNLLDGVSGFRLIGSNIPWTASGFTDTVHNAESRGYYRLEVQLEE